MKEGFIEINGKEYKKYLVGDDIHFRSTCDYEEDESKRKIIREFFGKIIRIPSYGEGTKLLIEFLDPKTKQLRTEEFETASNFELIEE